MFLLLMALLLAERAAIALDVRARRYFPAANRPRETSTFLTDIRAGFDYVRRAPLLQLLAVSAVLFSILYFSVSVRASGIRRVHQ